MRRWSGTSAKDAVDAANARLDDNFIIFIIFVVLIDELWLFNDGTAGTIGNRVLFNVPPYLQHNSAAHDGFGDTTLLIKFRIFARNEQQGNAILTAFFGGSIPTGSYKNGSEEAVLHPTLAGGKGFGRFDVQSTLRANLPVAKSDKLGRSIAWNTALQYHVGRAFFPEVEFNTTFYKGGPHNGNVQNFITPGLVGRWKIHARLGITLGAGMQLATSAYHSYDHGLILSARMPF